MLQPLLHAAGEAAQVPHLLNIPAQVHWCSRKVLVYVTRGMICIGFIGVGVIGYCVTKPDKSISIPLWMLAAVVGTVALINCCGGCWLKKLSLADYDRMLADSITRATQQLTTQTGRLTTNVQALSSVERGLDQTGQVMQQAFSGPTDAMNAGTTQVYAANQNVTDTVQVVVHTADQFVALPNQLGPIVTRLEALPALPNRPLAAPDPEIAEWERTAQRLRETVLKAPNQLGAV